MKRRFQQLLLPGIVFQSVLIGGAYATGREIVQYGARFGAAGAWSILVIGAGFSVMAGVCYEFARVSRCYDYRALVRELIGPAWVLFDLLYAAMVVVVIAVVSAAAGSVAEQVLGVPYALGVAGVIVVVAAVNAAGRAVIETFKSVGTALLLVGYCAFAGSVLTPGWSHVRAVLAGSLTAAGAGGTAVTGASAAGAPPVSLAAVLGVGLLYVGYNLAGLPSTLFVLDRQTSRAQALLAGLFTGLLSTVPFALTWLAVLAYYPDPAVLGAEVPWLVMLGRVGVAPLVAFYAVVVLWTLIETGVGMIHALLDRVSAARVQAGRAGLGRTATAALTAGILVVAAALSRLGIIALVARGYALMAYGFLALFALPLLTRGVARAWRSAR